MPIQNQPSMLVAEKKIINKMSVVFDGAECREKVNESGNRVMPRD